MEKVDIVIIGAGVVGLAIANQVARPGRNLIVVEKYPSFGQEASSHNSEVIHSGLYYPEGYLKARLCVEGNRLLYQFCERNSIPCKRLGKLIVATSTAEIKDLKKFLNRGRNNGVDLKPLSQEEIKRIEPNIYAIEGIYSPSTGILDSHQLMKKLEAQAKDKGVIFAYNCEVIAIDKKETYQVVVRDVDGQKLNLSTQIIINSAGLTADKIAQMAGIDIEKAGYKLHYSKGEYFRISASKAKLINHLVYPCPPKLTRLSRLINRLIYTRAISPSLGIHTVTDLQGQLKVGPNAFYVKEVNYDVDPSHANEFYKAAKRFFPFIEPDDLTPDMAGIRPQLQGPGEEVRDFIIVDEKDKGFPGLINLIGIESPGLTASLTIAKYVDEMI